MVQVEKTEGPAVTVRDIGEFSVGDVADVVAGDAEYLVEERGGFEYVDDTESSSESETAGRPDPVTHSIEDTIENGLCPWCDEYEGDAVGQHAASAHPDEWDAFKED